MIRMGFNPAGAKIFEGNCTVRVILPNGSQEKWESYYRRVYIVDGKVIIYNDSTGTISIIPADALVGIYS